MDKFGYDSLMVTSSPLSIGTVTDWTFGLLLTW